MNTEQLKELVSSTVRSEIKTQVNAPVNESIIAAVGITITALIAGAGFVTGAYMASKVSKQVEEFIAENLPTYHRDLDVLLRKFKYAKTMEDIDNIERAVDKHVDMLEKLLTRVDAITAKQVDGQSVRNLYRRRETKSVKKELQSYIKELRTLFLGRVSTMRQEMDVN